MVFGPKPPKKPPEPEPEPNPEFDSIAMGIIDQRTYRLKKAGAPDLVATAIATSRSVDIEYACRVVRGVLAQGLDPDVAVKILT